MIKPTIGRIVWYHPAFAADSGTNEATRAAIVCYVHSDTCVNLAIFDLDGSYHSKTEVELYQGDGGTPGSEYAEWMPYQKSVAAGEISPTLHAKTESLKTLTVK
jgi:hypothetical protein